MFTLETWGLYCKGVFWQYKTTQQLSFYILCDLWNIQLIHKETWLKESKTTQWQIQMCYSICNFLLSIKLKGFRTILVHIWNKSGQGREVPCSTYAPRRTRNKTDINLNTKVITFQAFYLVILLFIRHKEQLFSACQGQQAYHPIANPREALLIFQHFLSKLDDSMN